MIQRILYFASLLFVGVFFVSCSDNFNPKEDSLLEGKLSNSNREMLYLYELNLKSLDLIDSVRLDDEGVFKLIFKNKHKSGFYSFSVANSGVSILLQMNAGDKIYLEGNTQNLSYSYKVKNSESSELLQKLQSKINRSLDKADSIYEAYRYADTNNSNLAQLRILTDSLLQQNQIAHYQMIKDFARSNKNSLVSIYALYSTYGQKAVLDFELDYDLFKEVADALSRSYTNNIHVEDLQKRVNELAGKKQKEIDFENSLNNGNIFPEIELMDDKNQLIALSDLKGKITLVYFWSAQNKNCWDTNQRLIAMYKKFMVKKNFEIYAISFDTDKMLWMSAINIDKLAWKNVIMDIQHLENFYIKQLPRMFLLDSEGRIIQKDINLQQLNEFLVKP